MNTFKYQNGRSFSLTLAKLLLAVAIFFGEVSLLDF